MHSRQQRPIAEYGNPLGALNAAPTVNWIQPQLFREARRNKVSAMELVAKHPENRPFDPTEDMLVVVACEDVTTASQACALLKRVGSNAGTQGRLIYSWWTFSVLNNAQLRQFAAAEAAEADLVLIAAREGPTLPEPLKEWAQLWLTSDPAKFRSRALVAYLESSDTDAGVTSGVLSELRDFARVGGLDFFANGDKVPSAVVGEQYRRPAVSGVEQRRCDTATAGRLGLVLAETEV